MSHNANGGAKMSSKNGKTVASVHDYSNAYQVNLAFECLMHRLWKSAASSVLFGELLSPNFAEKQTITRVERARRPQFQLAFRLKSLEIRQFYAKSGGMADQKTLSERKMPNTI